MICARCLEELLATPSALRGFAHTHGVADHDADPVEACTVCGGSGRIEVTNHGVACLVRGCGPDAGCVLVSLKCLACERQELGDDLAWSASDRMSLSERIWSWITEVVVPPRALRIPVAVMAPARAPLFGLRTKLQPCNTASVIRNTRRAARV